MDDLNNGNAAPAPASGADPAPQETDSNPAPTQEDSEEVKAAKEQIAALENQLLQAGHVIEQLKKKAKPAPEQVPADPIDLDQKIREGVEAVLREKQSDSALLAEAEAKAKKLLTERDEALLALRSKQNRSGGSGPGHKPQPNPEPVRLNPAQERLARSFGLKPEELAK